MSTWRYPGLWDGDTIHHITDTHYGGRYFNPSWLDKAAGDLSELAPWCVGHANTGDCVNNATSEQFLGYRAWRDSIMADDGLPFIECAGNHDLDSNGLDGQRRQRSKEQWAQVMGLPAANQAIKMGEQTVISLSPDSWSWWDVRDPGEDGGPDTPNGAPMVLSPSTLEWLDQQLTAAGSSPCWLLTHTVPMGQYPGYRWGVEPSASITDVIDAHDNVAVWLSGHRHVDINGRPDAAKVMTFGSQKVFTINGPIGGGFKAAWDRWEGQMHSLFVTYTGDDLFIRYWNHLSSQWETSDGEYVRHLTLEAGP